MSKFNEQAQASIDLLDLNRAQERVNEILAPKGPVEVPAVEKPQRKKRSDAGVPKPKKVETKRGFLTVEEVAHIIKLMEEHRAAESNAIRSAERAAACKDEIYEFLHDLTIR